MSVILTNLQALYAHATLCERARTETFELYEADTLCRIINTFQEELRECLKPGTHDFQVKPQDDDYIVEPIGGWQ